MITKSHSARDLTDEREDNTYTPSEPAAPPNSSGTSKVQDSPSSLAHESQHLQPLASAISGQSSLTG